MGESAPLICMVQPSMFVTSWRSKWPAEELRRRGHQVQLDTMDGGYAPERPPEGALTVVHVTPSLWAVDSWQRKLEAYVEEATKTGRLIVSLDDDWTALEGEADASEEG